jgi:hypothetical protein
MCSSLWDRYLNVFLHSWHRITFLDATVDIAELDLLILALPFGGLDEVSFGEPDELRRRFRRFGLGSFFGFRSTLLGSNLSVVTVSILRTGGGSEGTVANTSVWWCSSYGTFLSPPT